MTNDHSAQEHKACMKPLKRCGCMSCLTLWLLLSIPAFIIACPRFDAGCYKVVANDLRKQCAIPRDLRLREKQHVFICSTTNTAFFFAKTGYFNTQLEGDVDARGERRMDRWINLRTDEQYAICIDETFQNEFLRHHEMIVAGAIKSEGLDFEFHAETPLFHIPMALSYRRSGLQLTKKKS